MDTAKLLLSHMTESDLDSFHARLKRTRKRMVKFSLNASISLMTRTNALSLVRAELATRPK